MHLPLRPNQCEFCKIPDAFLFLGTNEDKIIEILVRHNNHQRRRIAKAFGAAMGKVCIGMSIINNCVPLLFYLMQNREFKDLHETTLVTRKTSYLLVLDE